MAQYTTGTATVVHDSTDVIGISTTWDTLEPYTGGFLFKVYNDPGIYLINSFTDANNLVLSEPYQGISQSNVQYLIARDFTPNLGLPFIKTGDVAWPRLLSIALQKIDNALWTNTTKYIILEPQEETDVPTREGVMYFDNTTKRIRYHDGIDFRTLTIVT